MPRTSMVVLEIENYFSKNHGTVGDVETDHTIEVNRQFEEDAGKVSNKDHEHKPYAHPLYGLCANGFGDGKGPTASKGEQHHNFKNIWAEDIHSDSFPGLKYTPLIDAAGCR